MTTLAKVHINGAADGAAPLEIRSAAMPMLMTPPPLPAKAAEDDFGDVAADLAVTAALPLAVASAAAPANNDPLLRVFPPVFDRPPTPRSAAVPFSSMDVWITDRKVRAEFKFPPNSSQRLVRGFADGFAAQVHQAVAAAEALSGDHLPWFIAAEYGDPKGCPLSGVCITVDFNAKEMESSTGLARGVLNALIREL